MAREARRPPEADRDQDARDLIGAAIAIALGFVIMLLSGAPLALASGLVISFLVLAAGIAAVRRD